MSKDRDNIRELLSAYIDGETTQDQSRSIEQAVATDPELAMELHELKAAKRLLMGLPRERAPRGFVRKVMVRAERKHLLGDHHAGGSFKAARWITMAAAAVVLLSAGLGIIVVSTFNTQPEPIHIASSTERNEPSPIPGAPEGGGLDSAGAITNGAGAVRTKGGGTGGRTDINADGTATFGDDAFAYAVANADNRSINTHDVSDTLAVLHETLTRNDVQPLELEAPKRDATVDGPAVGKGTAASDKEERNVSRGDLNFYFNKKQDAEQVQIVVLATDTVIEQLNGDLDRLASVQMVSQAPAFEKSRGRSTGGVMARRTGPGRFDKTVQAELDSSNTTTARVEPGDGVTGNTGSRIPTGSKKATGGWGGDSVAKGAPASDPSPVAVPPKAPAAPVVVAKPTPKPSDPVDSKLGVGEIVILPPGVEAENTDSPGEGVSAGTTPGKRPVMKDNGEPSTTTVGGVEGLGSDSGGKDEIAVAQSKSKFDGQKPSPGRARRGSITKRMEDADLLSLRGSSQIVDAGELQKISEEIEKEQKRGKNESKLARQYSQLNSAFRRQIMDDDLRRNVQTQRERGVNVQALVININRRVPLGNIKLPATQNAIRHRYNQALSRPGGRTETAPAPRSTTQRAAKAVKTGK